MSTAALLEKFHHAAANPAEMKEKYLKEGKKIVLVNYYAPEEIVHAMGFVPMAAWGADTEIKDASEMHRLYDAFKEAGIYLFYHADNA